MSERMMHMMKADIPLLPEEMSAQVQLTGLLASNEHRQVFAATDIASGEPLILKWTDRNSADSAAQEFALLSKLDHPAIPKARAFARQDGRDFLLRSYAQGETLEALLRRDGCFTPHRTAEIAHALCDVLAYLHSQTPPVIFKDIKPENIVLTANGKLSLIDFGIAREQREAKDRDTRLMGSFPYASPEHLGFRHTDPRSDIFSLGRLMARLATNNPHGKTDDRQLGAIIRKCTRLEPGQRYQSAQQVQRALQRMLTPITRREAGIMALVALGIVVLGVWGASKLLQAPAPPQKMESSQTAEHHEQKAELLTEILLTAQEEGKSAMDVVLSANGTHWFQPGEGGQALLEVLPFREHVLRAAKGNRLVKVMASIQRGEARQSHSLNLDLAPRAPELIELTVTEETRRFSLPFLQTEGFEWATGLDGAQITQENGAWTLSVEDSLFPFTRILLMGKCVNQHGEADVTLLLKSPLPESVTEISNAEELHSIRNRLGGHYALTADIDLSGIANWEPIGTALYPFTGSLDGRGHRITGLSARQTTLEGCAGLFGKTENALIRRLVLSEPILLANHTAHGGTGPLIGWQAGGLTEYCAVLGGSVFADVGYGSGIGGAVGLNMGGMLRGVFSDAAITAATNSAFDKGETMSGGIAGSSSGHITGCGFAGELHSNWHGAGIVSINFKGTITNCYSAGALYVKPFQGVFPAGGICQTVTRQGRVSRCAFALGTASLGARVSRAGVLQGVLPLKSEDIKTGAGLVALRLDEDDVVFTLDPELSTWPLPWGIVDDNSPP